MRSNLCLIAGAACDFRDYFTSESSFDRWDHGSWAAALTQLPRPVRSNFQR